MRLSVVLFVCLFLHHVKSARILAVFPATGYSQFILADNLIQGLLKNGHEVTLISPFKTKQPHNNYRLISTETLITKVADWDLFSLTEAGAIDNMIATYEFGYFLSEETLKHPNVQDLLTTKRNFDLVIVEQFFCESLTAFASFYKAPLVLFSSIGASDWNSNLMGNPSLPAISPLCFLAYTREMSFVERVHNLYLMIYEYFYKMQVSFPFHAKLVRSHFPNEIDFYQSVHNASLMLLNSHVATSEMVPLTQNMVEIGGFYIKKCEIAPELSKILDNATQGVILFSLGTNLNVSNLPIKVLNGILKAFSQLKQTILWKTDVELENKPNNVITQKWLNQSDILAHKNVRLFITHGGLLSTTEAVYYGVPIIGIPIFGDQKMNVARATKIGFGLTLNHNELNEKNLLASIVEVLDNTSFSKKAQELSKYMKDVAVAPLDLAVFSIEKVLRHKSVSFRSPASKLYWFQLYSLDLLVLGFSFIFAIVLAVWLICSKCLNSDKKIAKPKNKSKQT